MADEARVVIDVLDDPAIGGGIRHCAEVLATYLAEHDRERLLEYADLLDNGAVLKRLGYLCERMDLTDEAFLEACEERLTAGIALLDPSVPEQGGWSARWRVRENVVLEPGTTS